MTSFAVAGDDETKAEEVQARTAEKAAPAAILVENTSADAHVDGMRLCCAFLVVSSACIVHAHP